MLKPEDVVVTTLGKCPYASPLRPAREGGFVAESARILQQFEVSDDEPLAPAVSFEKAGPRKRILFDPAQTTAAIVTCGGLCPGLNNVIRSATLELIHNYGAKRVLGIRYGFRGLNPQVADAPIVLTPEVVERIGPVQSSERMTLNRLPPQVCPGEDNLPLVQALLAGVARRCPTSKGSDSWCASAPPAANAALPSPRPRTWHRGRRS